MHFGKGNPAIDLQFQFPGTFMWSYLFGRANNWEFLFPSFIFITCVCVRVRMCMHIWGVIFVEWRWLQRPEASDPSGAGLTVNSLMCALGIELQSSGRAVHALNFWAFFPDTPGMSCVVATPLVGVTAVGTFHFIHLDRVPPAWQCVEPVNRESKLH